MRMVPLWLVVAFLALGLTDPLWAEARPAVTLDVMNTVTPGTKVVAVVQGDSVQVRYTVSALVDSSSSDLIELRRVDNGSVVSSQARGDSLSGTVSLSTTPSNALGDLKVVYVLSATGNVFATAQETVTVEGKGLLVFPGPATVQSKSVSIYRGQKVIWIETKRDAPVPGKLIIQISGGRKHRLEDLFSFQLQLRGEAKPRKLELVRVVTGELSQNGYAVLRVRYGRNVVVFAVDMSTGVWVREKVFCGDPLGVKRAREEFEPHLILDEKVGPIRVEWVK
ncbi:MAG: hypothetical protein Q7T82_02310 [Armatimonadota bacterium]|nr:hypothetical protein [Armatimonadota bacterium]